MPDHPLDHPTAVMMFAAGFGTRMEHLTKSQPKPLIPVLGKPLIDHALALATDFGADPIVANLHYKPEKLQHHLQSCGVQTILETPDILETGGGLRNALSLLGPGPVFTMNTDAVWSGPNPLRLLADSWRPDAMDALLIAVPPERAIGHKGPGDFTIGANGSLRRGPGVVYGGIQILKTDLLDDIVERKFSLNLLWDRMQADGRLFGFEYPGKWCDVGHPAGIGLAEQMLMNDHV